MRIAFPDHSTDNKAPIDSDYAAHDTVLKLLFQFGAHSFYDAKRAIDYLHAKLEEVLSGVPDDIATDLTTPLQTTENVPTNSCSSIGVQTPFKNQPFEIALAQFLSERIDAFNTYLEEHGSHLVKHSVIVSFYSNDAIFNLNIPVHWSISGFSRELSDYIPIQQRLSELQATCEAAIKDKREAETRLEVNIH